MDMGAYLNIGDLGEVAKANGIDVPRLRGYRLMRDQQAWTEEDIAKEVAEAIEHAYRSLADATVRMAEDAMRHDIRAYEADKSWLSMYEDEVHSYEKAFRKQMEMWNRYCGHEDVLYIHSRMGGSRMTHWDDEVGRTVTDYDLKGQPWFLDWCFDAYDGTYIDIYARIDPATVKEKE